MGEGRRWWKRGGLVRSSRHQDSSTSLGSDSFFGQGARGLGPSVAINSCARVVRIIVGGSLGYLFFSAIRHAVFEIYFLEVEGVIGNVSGRVRGSKDGRGGKVGMFGVMRKEMGGAGPGL